MKLAYTHPNGIVVAQVRSVLELAGIESVLRNEFASGAIGELAPIDAWPEVWVMRDRDCEAAIRLLEEAQKTVNEADWECALCDNASPATFEYCWRCGPSAASKQSGVSPIRRRGADLAI